MYSGSSILCAQVEVLDVECHELGSFGYHGIEEDFDGHQVSRPRANVSVVR